MSVLESCPDLEQRAVGDFSRAKSEESPAADSISAVVWSIVSSQSSNDATMYVWFAKHIPTISITPNFYTATTGDTAKS